MTKAVRLFNEGKYWEAHELLEAVWKQLPRGKDREYLQGLIQACGAFVHLEKSDFKPALSLAKAALAKLESTQGSEFRNQIEIPGLEGFLQIIVASPLKNDKNQDFLKTLKALKAGTRL